MELKNRDGRTKGWNQKTGGKKKTPHKKKKKVKGQVETAKKETGTNKKRLTEERSTGTGEGGGVELGKMGAKLVRGEAGEKEKKKREVDTTPPASLDLLSTGGGGKIAGGKVVGKGKKEG